MFGVMRKLRRLFYTHSGRIAILSLDHGASDGMIAGIGYIPKLIDAVAGRLVQGIILNKGLARAYIERITPATTLFVQLSSGTKHGLPTYNKSLVCSVSEALRLGADIVSIHVNIGNDLEDRMLADFGMVVDEAHQLGIPVLAVLLARGGHIVNECNPSLVAHCIRLGAELGADLLCVPFSKDRDSFANAITASPTPVLVAGGPLAVDFQGFLCNLATAMECGAAGVSVGRNVFQNKDPLQALDQILALVHDNNASNSVPCAMMSTDE
ncbi:2-amino-3,7-dideoxy-D-threo-hept-6-ulosonate synthase [Desulfovibrionales bacterium]